MKIFLRFCFVISIFSFAWTGSSGQVFTSLKAPYTFLAGAIEPDPDWFMPAYDDSGWGMDTGIIGYGYGFEDIPIDTNATSIYLRFRFQVEDKKNFTEANFFGDYDDGYIAYLNGKEIVRVNIDKNIETPAYNQLTTRSHEMQLYGWDNTAVLGYYLDSLMLDSCLVTGENVIAVQVLNDSVNGSDLQFILALFNLTYSSYNIYYQGSRYKRQFSPDSSTLPLVIIETDEFGIPYHHIRRKAFMGIIDNGSGKYNHPGDSCNVYYGDVSMELRGESSKDFPKRSYRFELIDSAEADSSVALLGMPSDDDWILFGPMHDKSLFRNPMVFDMGRNLNGSYQPRSRFCEVYFNGEYIGVYSLLETIKRDDDRVDIARLRPEETSGLDLTGGYILRFDKPSGNLQIAYPKADNLQPEQEVYIFGYYNEYSSVLQTSYFRDPVNGFRKYINDTSLVDFLIVNEITKNADSYLYSTYLYKDRDDRDRRFHYGPLWDMNLAFGNSIFQGGDRYDEWQFDNSANSNNRLKAKKMFQDEALVDLFQERWHAARQGVFHTDSLLAYIDSMVTFLEEPRIRNYIVWPVIDKDIFHPNYHSMSYEEEINYMKSWLINRLDWMDDNIGDIYYPVVVPDILPGMEGIEFSYGVYPNPFVSEISVDVITSRDTEMKFEIYSLMGNRLYTHAEQVAAGNSRIILGNDQIQNMTSGIYLLKVSVDGKPYATQRIIKQ